jgi:NADP-dependent 3-hydroxy acid dehydrogenase YdfG
VQTLMQHKAMEVRKSLQNQVAVVTGASSGIGRAIATALATQGASVFLASRSQENLELAASSIREADAQAKVSVCPTDLRNEQEIERLAETVERDAVGLDILVHSAGLYGRGAMDQSSAEGFDQLYKTNVRGPFLLTKALLPALRLRKGQMLFINSTTSLIARAGVGQFSATQHAFRAMADAFREELNVSGIRVLNMFLGRTATPRIEALYEQDARPYRAELLMQPEDVAAMALSALILPKTAEVTDIHMRPLVKSY